MKIISKSDIEKIINIEDAISAVEGAFVKYTDGSVDMPQRHNIGPPETNGNVLFMPAHIYGENYLGSKVVSVYPDNPSRGKQTIYSVLILNDAQTGEPLALMDAELITAYRTGAITGVASKYLALENAKIVSIWGAGVQAKQQLEAVCAVRNIEKINVFDIDLENREQFVKEMKDKLKVNVVGCDDEKQALAESDIIITATTSKKPVISGSALKSGVFISAVGGSTRDKQEIPESIMEQVTIIVDGYEAAMTEAGDILIPMEKGLITRENVKGELGEVIKGDTKRQDLEEKILFKSVGLAIQDISVASSLYQKALSLGLGQDVIV